MTLTIGRKLVKMLTYSAVVMVASKYNSVHGRKKTNQDACPKIQT